VTRHTARIHFIDIDYNWQVGTPFGTGGQATSGTRRDGYFALPVCR
jgi:hypothetical protein